MTDEVSCYLCTECRYVDVDAVYPTGCLIEGRRPENGWCPRNVNTMAIWRPLPPVVSAVIMGSS